MPESLADCFVNEMRSLSVVSYELCSDDESPCRHHVCDYGGLCVLKSQRAVCVCPADCPDYFQPVCIKAKIHYTIDPNIGLSPDLC